jgi:hypothetical protein
VANRDEVTHMIDIHRERILTPAQAARVRPPGRKGRPTNVATVYRWIKKGVRGVKLEGIRIGGSLYTSQEALQRFAERLTNRTSAPAVSHAPPDARHERNVDQALAELGYS